MTSKANCEKKWSCYGDDGSSVSSADSSVVNSEGSSTTGGASQHSASPFHSYGSHRRATGEVAADPTEIIEYARFLGIDPVKEPQLLHMAEEGLFAPLPGGWTEHKDAEGNIFYYNQGIAPGRGFQRERPLLLFLRQHIGAVTAGQHPGSASHPALFFFFSPSLPFQKTAAPYGPVCPPPLFGTFFFLPCKSRVGSHINTVVEQYARNPYTQKGGERQL